MITAAFAAKPDRPAHIAYVVMGFPRISETFISNEMLLLESLGLRLHVFGVKRGDDDRVHASVAALLAPVEYLPRMSSLSGTPFVRWWRENAPRYLPAHGRVLRRRPLAWLRTAIAALAMSWRYRKSRFAGLRKVFIKEFLQAGAIADRILESGDFTQLHGHFCHGATTITWFASRLTGLPFSFTAHAKDIYQVDQNPGDLLERKLRAARFVVTCTDANRAHLDERFPGAARVHTIYHGLDTQYFHAPTRTGRGAVPLVLAVGRFVEKKGLRFLVEACANVRASGQPMRCVLVGEDGGELPVIRGLIESLGLRDVVEILPPMTHDELRRLYEAADVFALPCTVAGDGDRDGIPNVLAEAMAMGLPVVTTPISGIPEIVTDGVDGVFVPPRDAEAIASALMRLLGDPVLRERLGHAARATICAKFDSRRTTQHLHGLLVGCGDANCAHASEPVHAGARA